MLRIALCDDEVVFESQIRKCLDIFSWKYNIEIYFQYFNSAAALLGAPFDYDVLFLDIMLENGMDGIEIGKQLREKGNNAIFILTTSRNDRHKDGYQASVLRYLTKPILEQEFDEALRAVIQTLQLASTKFEIKFKNLRRFVNLNDIVMIESYNRKRFIYVEMEKYPTTESWEKLLQRLPEKQFYLLQKCFMINFAHVVEANKTLLTMSNHRQIRYVKGRYEDFNKAFQRFLGDSK